MAPQIQRMLADDLMAAVFPDSAACQDNLPGDREIPDHPLVGQTIHDCLEEAMDASAFERLLEDIHSGKKQRVARDLTGPSPFARQVLNARPYAFLDDAPLEERRTQAVLARRWLDPATASDLGALDAAAIQRVESEVWPQPQTPDELHDALVLLGFVTVEEGLREGWTGLFEPLARDGRAAELCAGAARLWIAAERLKELELIYPRASLTPHITPPADLRTTADSFETALVEVLRGRLESTGPVTAAELSRSAGLPVEPVQVALASLEGEGFVLRGGFTPGAAEEQWCERRLLARIHRYTLTRLRSEIEPVSAADFMGFLLEWQRLSAVRRMQGPDALSAVLGQLEGFQAPAAAWEGEILPARVKDYDPSWLDTLCLSGRIVWARLTPSAPAPGTKRAGPVRATPIALLPRSSQAVWAYRSDPSAPLELSARADSVLHHLQRSGASFFQEMVAAAHCPRTEVEEGLAELVSAGLATSDSFSGLRALLAPSNQRRPLVARRKRGRVAELGMESAGRWALLERPGEPTADSRPDAAAIEHVARALLRRYGVVFHRILERESVPHPWRDLLRVFYRLEARGEVRGGRFVAGFAGQQFALSEAVTLLRSTRRRDKRGELVSMSAADPLNLVGLITPGERVPALTSNRICLRDGIPIACKVGDDVRFLIELEPPQRWEATSVLLRRTVPQQLKAYLGKSA